MLVLALCTSIFQRCAGHSKRQSVVPVSTRITVFDCFDVCHFNIHGHFSHFDSFGCPFCWDILTVTSTYFGAFSHFDTFCYVHVQATHQEISTYNV